MSRGNGIEEHRRYIKARVSTISSNCPICINNNKNNITTVNKICELHHIFGRATANPNSPKESIFGVIALCNKHHQEYPPLLSVEEYHRNKEHWDILFSAYWRNIGSFNFISEEEMLIRDQLLTLSIEEFIEYFAGG